MHSGEPILCTEQTGSLHESRRWFEVRKKKKKAFSSNISFGEYETGTKRVFNFFTCLFFTLAAEDLQQDWKQDRICLWCEDKDYPSHTLIEFQNSGAAMQTISIMDTSNVLYYIRWQILIQSCTNPSEKLTTIQENSKDHVQFWEICPVTTQV